MEESVTPNLWPYAVRNANEAVNHTPSFQDEKRRTPIDLFAGTEVSSNPKHWKTFGAPAYVLENELQGRNPFHKWRHRSKPGIYLGTSPQHGRNVLLVLSRETGLVSPQFHVAFDQNFDTVKDIRTTAMWQVKAGFVTQREHVPRDRPAPDETPMQGKRSVDDSENVKGGSETSRKRKKTDPATAIKGAGNKVVQEKDACCSKCRGRRPTDTSNIWGGPTTTRSGRKAKPPPRLINGMAAEIETVTASDVLG